MAGGAWNPANEVICTALAALPHKIELCLPGGFCLSHIWDSIYRIPHGADLPLQFFSQIGPALSALQPVFTIVDTVVAIHRCLTAIPDAILHLDPGEIFECMPDLVEQINKLLSIIPQLSVPRMVKQAILAIAQLLEGLATDISYLAAQFSNVLESIDKAADLQDVTLNGFAMCRQRTLDDAALTTGEALQGLGRIVLLINIMIGLFGGKVEVPCFSSIFDTDDLDGLGDILLGLAAFLRELANLIPDPQWIITRTLGETRC